MFIHFSSAISYLIARWAELNDQKISSIQPSASVTSKISQIRRQSVASVSQDQGQVFEALASMYV